MLRRESCWNLALPGCPMRKQMEVGQCRRPHCMQRNCRPVHCIRCRVRSSAFRGAHLKRVHSTLLTNGLFSFTYILTVFLFDYQFLYQHGVYTLWAAPLYFHFSSRARTHVSAAGLRAPYLFFSTCFSFIDLGLRHTRTTDRGGVT